MVKEKFHRVVEFGENERTGGEQGVVLPVPKSSQEEHEEYEKIKHGTRRLDRRSAQGVSGQPKKSGQGGKFTWAGKDPEWAQDAPIALDKNDPNYVDEETEERDKQVASSTVEVAKSATSGQSK